MAEQRKLQQRRGILSTSSNNPLLMGANGNNHVPVPLGMVGGHHQQHNNHGNNYHQHSNQNHANNNQLHHQESFTSNHSFQSSFNHHY